ncbi:hypothetical protein HOY80DRAFT_1006315 [Tuber brumale]|nr:hypothetical protein HOY80DRAFT_1006315 [Tuber brumale]
MSYIKKQNRNLEVMQLQLQSFAEKISRNPTDHMIWTPEESEQLIEWLEESENQQKLKKGSGITKKQIFHEISLQISTKPPVKVGYKYDNLLKSYRKAVRLNSESGWGLTESDFNIGRKALRGK